MHLCDYDTFAVNTLLIRPLFVGIYAMIAGIYFCTVPLREAEQAGRHFWQWTNANCRIWRFTDICSVCALKSDGGAEQCGVSDVARYSNGCQFDILIRYDSDDGEEDSQVAEGNWYPEYEWDGKEYDLAPREYFNQCPGGKGIDFYVLFYVFDDNV